VSAKSSKVDRRPAPFSVSRPGRHDASCRRATTSRHRARQARDPDGRRQLERYGTELDRSAWPARVARTARDQADLCGMSDGRATVTELAGRPRPPARAILKCWRRLAGLRGRQILAATREQAGQSGRAPAARCWPEPAKEWYPPFVCPLARVLLAAKRGTLHLINQVAVAGRPLERRPPPPSTSTSQLELAQPPAPSGALVELACVCVWTVLTNSSIYLFCHLVAAENWPMRKPRRQGRPAREREVKPRQCARLIVAELSRADSAGYERGSRHNDDGAHRRDTLAPRSQSCCSTAGRPGCRPAPERAQQQTRAANGRARDAPASRVRVSRRLVSGRP
jgi:hypothetical protein